MFNHITILGRLTKDPELRRTQKGDAVTTITVAVNRDYDKDAADFFAVVAWNKTAEFISLYFKKGDGILVSGAMQSRAYTDKNGNNQRVWELRANHVYFNGERKKAAETPPVASGDAPANEYINEYDDDLPF